MDMQIIIAANALAVSTGVFFIKLWINGIATKIKDLENKVESKVSDALCCERRKGMKEDIDDLYNRMREHEREKPYGQGKTTN